ncbi:MAG TPA: multiubiquitin domain-containing protein [Steroidobacteraceae bacterium]|nr:multiubiquitin domain-containing protein [Steroidobacteraceae bacterium]
MESTDISHAGHGQHPPVVPPLVAINVNERPVQVPHETTGLGIKEAAIAQGVPIKLDFILSEERPNGQDKIIGDNDDVKVHHGTRFLERRSL